LKILNTISGVRGLLALNWYSHVLKRQREWTYVPPSVSSSELARGVPLLASGGRGLISTKSINKQNLGRAKYHVRTVAEAAGSLWVHGL
jgi:hypothetical protein